MTSFNDRLGRMVERRNAAYERENRRAQRGTGTSSRNASADLAASLVLDREWDTAREAVRDARDDLARLKADGAHRDDIDDAREVLADARADLRALRGDDN